MKSKIILITSIIVIAMATDNLRAQAFEPASNSHNTVPSTWSGVGRVSCDITVYQFSSSQRNVFQVMAWDGASPSWYYDVLNFFNGSSQWSGTISLPHSDAVNPDICILAEKETGSPARVYVIVIYQRSGAAGIWTAHYRWDNTNHLFINYSPPGQSQVINVSAATIRSMPQIDADRYDHFAAVWAEAGSNQVHGFSGDMYGGHIHYDCYNNELDGVSYIPVPSVLTNPYPCVQPDICIGSDNNNLGGYYMHVVFKTNDGYLCVQDYRAGDFCATGSPRGSYILDGNIAGYDCNYPRIAAPRDFVTASTGLTQYGYGVVYEKKDNSTGITDAYGIVNWCTYSSPTLTCAFGNVQNYTNGSAYFQGSTVNRLPQISASGTVTRPVIAYDSYTGTYNPNVNANGNSIVVGFNYDDGSNPQKPAAFYANVGTGQPQLTPNIFNTNFNEVSNNTTDNQGLLSMAGESDETNAGSSAQNYKNMLYCWYDADTREVLYKTVQNISHFRVASSGSFSFSVYPNPVADYITVSGIDSHSAYEVFISDLKGQVIYHAAAGGNNVNENLNQAIGSLANGMYLLQLKNSSGENGFVKLNIIH